MLRGWVLSGWFGEEEEKEQYRICGWNVGFMILLALCFSNFVHPRFIWDSHRTILAHMCRIAICVWPQINFDYIYASWGCVINGDVFVLFFCVERRNLWFSHRPCDDDLMVRILCGWYPNFHRLTFSIIHRNHLASIERTTTTFGKTKLRIQIYTGCGKNNNNRLPAICTYVIQITLGFKCWVCH